MPLLHGSGIRFWWSFLLGSRPFLWRRLWAYFIRIFKRILPLFLPGPQGCLFLDLHCENLVRFLEVKPMKVCLPSRLPLPRVSHFHSSLHSASSSLPKISVRCPYKFIALLASVSGKHISFVTLDLPIPHDFRMVVCSETSFPCWVQEKSLIFSLFSFLLFLLLFFKAILHIDCIEKKSRDKARSQ